MFSIEMLALLVIAVFVLGAIVGAIISRIFAPPHQQKELEQHLQASRDELANYQNDVAQHFAETSKLVNNLAQNYKDVHEHLAKGAIALTNPEITKQILSAGEEKLGLKSEDSINEVHFDPPKDWAPKTPGQTGTLSEEYGLHDEHDEHSPIEVRTAGGDKSLV